MFLYKIRKNPPFGHHNFRVIRAIRGQISSVDHLKPPPADVFDPSRGLPGGQAEGRAFLDPTLPERQAFARRINIDELFSIDPDLD